MSDRSKIEWTDATWNPLRARNPTTGKVGWHCVKISPACTHCYAWRQNVRLGTGLNYADGSPAEVYLDERTLTQPFRWQRPRRIFVCSMTDLFGEWVSDATIDLVFAAMALCPRHTFQVLTKRPDRMAAYCRLAGPRVAIAQRGDWKRTSGHWTMVCGPADDFAWPLPNVWCGVTAEDHERLMERLDPLLATPAAVRFLSIEPLLERIDLGLRNWAHIGRRRDDCRLDWVIVGGESGGGARPMHPDWVRSIRDECTEAGVAFFFKQWGEWKPISEMQESEWEPYYVSRRKAKPYERQCDIDDLCGRRCTIRAAAAARSLRGRGGAARAAMPGNVGGGQTRVELLAPSIGMGRRRRAWSRQLGVGRPQIPGDRARDVRAPGGR
jgi:protein gp37